MRDVYVYYRIEPRMAERAATQINALLDALTSHCARSRRAQRCDDPATWMEVYEGVDDLDSFSVALDDTVSALDCAAFTCGERHVECFERTTTI